MQTDLVIGVLNHNRYELLDRTLKSMLPIGYQNQLSVRWALWDNGSDEGVREKIVREWGHHFSLAEYADENMGIGAGLNGLHSAARKLGARYYLHLENDWECQIPGYDWLLNAVDVLQSNDQVGIIKLRQENDGQYEMMGANVTNGTAEKYSPWWLRPMPDYVNSEFTHGGVRYHYAKVERGYTNNPHILKMEMIKDWCFDDSVQGYGLEEEKAETRPAREGWATANLEHGVFKHIG